MNFSLFNLTNFFNIYFPSLYLVQFSATQFQLWDKKDIIWAKVEVEKNTIKIVSIQQKSQVANSFKLSEKQETAFLELNKLAIEFDEHANQLLEETKKDFIERKKEIENQFRKGFSAKQKESLQPIIQLLEEGGHSLYLLSEWIAVFEFWNIIYEKSKFKKSFFKRHEILKSLNAFSNTSNKSEIPASYSKLESFVNDFVEKSEIKESELLLYGIFNDFLNSYEESKLNFIAIIQQKIYQSKPRRIWSNDNQILKSLEVTSEKFKRKTLFGMFENFTDLLLTFSTQNETSQFALETRKSISQVGIFGLSKNSELINEIEKTDYDLIILDTEKQRIPLTKEISLFQVLSKKDKLFFASLQRAFKSLSENGILFVILTENQKHFTEKKSLSSLRRLLQEWFERIEVYEIESYRNTNNNLGIFFYKKLEEETKLEKGVFYSKFENHKIYSTSNFTNNFLIYTWKPKPILSEYQKLIPSVNQEGNKNAIFKTYFRAIPNQKVENFIELCSYSDDANNNSENNLKNKVKEFIQEHNQQIIKSEEQIKNKLEKKKDMSTSKLTSKLNSKLTSNMLFEEEVLEKINQKIEETKHKFESQLNGRLDNKQNMDFLEFNESNLIQTQVSVFEEGFWYYEKYSFQEHYDLDKLFPDRKRGENILIFWASTENGGEVWATNKPIPPTFLSAILPNAYIFPFYVYENGKKKNNFSKNILHKFRRGYAAAFEKRTEKIEESIQFLFDLSDFEFLQVNQELAFELRVLSNSIDRDESKMTKELKENLHAPETNTYIQFEQIKKVFINTKRTFERLESKAARNRESFDILRSYFKNGESAIEEIENYWQKLETEDADDFVVPTEENMTDELILGYIFAVWQHPSFKSKYKEELKSKIPRIPIYKDFHYFANKGSYDLQKFLKDSNSTFSSSSTSKINFEIVEVFEEESKSKSKKSTKKSSRIWFEKENKIWFDKTTFLYTESELDFDKIKRFAVNKKPFFELTLKYLRKNKVDLQKGKKVLENVIDFLSKF